MRIAPDGDVTVIVSQSRKAHGAEGHLDRVRELSPEAKMVVYMFEARLPADDIIDILAWRYHDSSRNSLAEDDVRVAQIEFLHIIHEIRKTLDV